MNFGLRQQDLDEIIRTLQKFSLIEEAIIFGSRAKGTFKKGSDIDIAIKEKGIDHELVASLSFLLNEESAMPYFLILSISRRFPKKSCLLISIELGSVYSRNERNER